METQGMMLQGIAAFNKTYIDAKTGPINMVSRTHTSTRTRMRARTERHACARGTRMCLCWHALFAPMHPHTHATTHAKVHYAPGIEMSGNAATRKSMWGAPDGGCLAPGAPTVESCGYYHVIEYASLQLTCRDMLLHTRHTAS